MATQPHHRYTLAEYADIDSAADVRCEYLDGAIYAMAGGSPDHAQIESNLTRHLGNALAGGPCRVWGSTMRVQAVDLRTYPDLSVICGPPAFAAEPRYTLLNPTVLFEVLSPSTQDYDRGLKFAYYRQIPSLVAYVLVAQDRRWVEVRTRTGPDDWAVTTLTVPDAVLTLPEPPLTLSLTAIYEQVALP